MNVEVAILLANVLKNSKKLVLNGANSSENTIGCRENNNN